jgi:sulfite reductase beta subunit-like hemoprotein
MSEKKVSEVEIIKDKSRYLRGTIEESLNNQITGAVATDDTQLMVRISKPTARLTANGSVKNLSRCTRL